MERQDLEGASAATSDDGAIDLRRLLSALDARKRWIVIPTIAATCLALAFVTLVSPRYIAITKVTLENQQTYYNRPDKSAPELATPLVYDAEGVQSEAETIATEELARKAVEKLGLVRNSEFNPESQNPLSMLLSLFSRRADADPEGRVADAVLSRLTVFAVAKSRVLQIEFSRIAQVKMDREGKELTSEDIWDLFQHTYFLEGAPLTLVKQQIVPTGPDNRELIAKLRKADGSTMNVEGEGNGPIDAFVDALKKAFGLEFSFLDYHEHAVGRGANATAACYVEIQDSEGRVVHGVGIDPSIVNASLKSTLSAVQRLMAEKAGRE